MQFCPWDRNWSQPKDVDWRSATTTVVLSRQGRLRLDSIILLECGGSLKAVRQEARVPSDRHIFATAAGDRTQDLRRPKGQCNMLADRRHSTVVAVLLLIYLLFRSIIYITPKSTCLDTSKIQAPAREVYSGSRRLSRSWAVTTSPTQTFSTRPLASDFRPPTQAFSTAPASNTLTGVVVVWSVAWSDTVCKTRVETKKRGVWDERVIVSRVHHSFDTNGLSTLCVRDKGTNTDQWLIRSDWLRIIGLALILFVYIVHSGPQPWCSVSGKLNT